MRRRWSDCSIKSRLSGSALFAYPIVLEILVYEILGHVRIGKSVRYFTRIPYRILYFIAKMHVFESGNVTVWEPIHYWFILRGTDICFRAATLSKLFAARLRKGICSKRKKRAPPPPPPPFWSKCLLFRADSFRNGLDVQKSIQEVAIIATFLKNG